ncbi:MAG: ABC transporter permease, partial [Shinella sp.]
MESLRSNALEPTRSELAGLAGTARLLRLLPVYGLPLLTLALILFFSLILPDTFPTLLNLRAVLGEKAVIALLSLAAMIPMMTGRIDLTVGYGIVIWHVLAISLQTVYGLHWSVAVLIVLAGGCLLGLINGLLVEVAQIDSFIATLGTGTLIYAAALWHTEGRQVIGLLPPAFTALYTTQLFGLPIAAFYVLAIAMALWLVSDYLPIGRYLYAIGANSRAAELNGIRTRRFVIGAFVASGLIGAFAGVVLAAKLRIGQA